MSHLLSNYKSFSEMYILVRIIALIFHSSLSVWRACACWRILVSMYIDINSIASYQIDIPRSRSSTLGVERQTTILKLGSEPALELPWWKRVMSPLTYGAISRVGGLILVCEAGYCPWKISQAVKYTFAKCFHFGSFLDCFSFRFQSNIRGPIFILPVKTKIRLMCFLGVLRSGFLRPITGSIICRFDHRYRFFKSLLFIM